jgi:hypothetical protein
LQTGFQILMQINLLKKNPNNKLKVTRESAWRIRLLADSLIL